MTDPGPSLALATRHELRTVAFPGISTGIYGYPIDEAAAVAAREIAAWLDANNRPERVILCAFGGDSMAAMGEALRRLDRPDLTGPI